MEVVETETRRSAYKLNLELPSTSLSSSQATGGAIKLRGRQGVNV